MCYFPWWSKKNGFDCCLSHNKWHCKWCRMQNIHIPNEAKSMQMHTKITIICGTTLCSSKSTIWLLLFVFHFIRQFVYFFHSFIVTFLQLIVFDFHSCDGERGKKAKTKHKRNCHSQNIWFDTSSSVYWWFSIHIYMVRMYRIVCSIRLCNAILYVCIAVFLLQSHTLYTKTVGVLLLGTLSALSLSLLCCFLFFHFSAPFGKSRTENNTTDELCTHTALPMKKDICVEIARQPNFEVKLTRAPRT